jgi:hypothetical protein
MQVGVPVGPAAEMHLFWFGKSSGRSNYDVIVGEIESISSILVTTSRALATRGASLTIAAFMRAVEFAGNNIDEFKILLSIPVEHY